MALINTTTTGIQGSTFYADGTGDLTIQQNGQTIAKVVNQPAFSAYPSASAQTLSNNVTTKVVLDVKAFDTASCFDTSTYRFTPNISGYYQINGVVTVSAGTGTGTIIAVIYRNGSWLISNDGWIGNTGNRHSSIVSSIIYLNGTTDYVELQAYQDSGSSKTITNSFAHTSFNGCLLRAA